MTTTERQVLTITHKVSTYHKNGLWYPSKSFGQEEAFEHFSNGYDAIANEDKDKLIFIADLHGWDVESTNAPTNI